MRHGRDARSGRQQGLLLPLATAYLLPGLLLCLASLELFLSSPSAASGLLAPAAGSADAATAGSTIAEPLSPLGAQFGNPAGLAGFGQSQLGTSLGLAYGRGVVTADVPAGYHAENEVLVPFLESFLTIPWGRWTFSIATMGTSGARFDYGARPSLGVDDGFFSESSVLAVPIAAAYRVSDQWWLGAQITPLYGSTHLRYSRPVAELAGATVPFRFTVEGFGVQGMIGVTWKPDDAWAVGLSYKPPGRIWADGDTRLGSGKQDVDLELEAPQEVALGVTRAFLTDWKASYGVRFIDTSVLSSSTIRFSDTPSANTPYLTDARDEWRHALGLEYSWSERLTLLGGFSKANGIVGSKGTNPSSYDSRDLRLSTGVRWDGETWNIDGAFGYIFAGSRHVSADDAMVFPGKYDSKPSYLLSITLTKKF